MNVPVPRVDACVRLPIVLVDDEPTFRLSLAEALRDDGHVVLDYPSANDVPPLHALPADAVLLTDFEMPGTNGLDLADAFRRAHLRGRAILMSAYNVPVVDGSVAARPWLRFASKPIDYDALHELIHAA